MRDKKFKAKWEREQINGVWFYLLKWHFIYVLFLLPLTVLINNWGLLISSLSNLGTFWQFFSNISFSNNGPIPYLVASSFAAGASFLKWKLNENKYFKLKVKEYKA